MVIKYIEPDKGQFGRIEYDETDVEIGISGIPPYQAPTTERKYYDIPLTGFNTQSDGAELSVVDLSDWAAWDYYAGITITPDTNLPSGYTIGVNIDTPISEGKSDYSDIRILYLSGSAYTEIDRDIRDIGEGLLCYFALQGALTSASTTDYIVVWGNSSPPPVMNDRDNVYLLHDDCDSKTGWTDFYGTWGSVGGRFVQTVQFHLDRTLKNFELPTSDVTVYGLVNRNVKNYAHIAIRGDITGDGDTWILGIYVGTGGLLVRQYWIDDTNPEGFRGNVAFANNPNTDYVLKCKVVGNDFKGWAAEAGTPITGAPLITWTNATANNARYAGFASEANGWDTEYDDLYVIKAVANDPTIAMAGKQDVPVPMVITVNAVNKILYMGKYSAERVYGGLFIYDGDIWAISYFGTKIFKYKTSDLTANGVINLVYGGVNVAANMGLKYIYTDGSNIYGLLWLGDPHVIVWNMDGTFVREQIDDGVTPGVQIPWAMVSDGTHLYIIDWLDRSVKKYLLDGTYVDKSATNSIPVSPASMCIGTVSGNLYVCNRVGAYLAEINPTTLVQVASVRNLDGPASQFPGQIEAVDADRVFMTPQYYGVTIRGLNKDADERGGFCRFYGRSDEPGNRTPGDLQLSHGCSIGFDGDYIYIWDGGTYDPGYTPVMPYFFHKIYVKEDRTIQISFPITKEDLDLLTIDNWEKLVWFGDSDGAVITWSASEDNSSWTEITDGDLSSFTGDSLYFKVQLDNLQAKVGSPIINSVIVSATGIPDESY